MPLNCRQTDSSNIRFHSKQLPGLMKALFFSHSAYRLANKCFRASCCCDFEYVTGEGTWAFLSITNRTSLRRMYPKHKAHLPFKRAVSVVRPWVRVLSGLPVRTDAVFLLHRLAAALFIWAAWKGEITLGAYLQNETSYFAILITICVLHHLLFLPWRFVPVPLHSLRCILVSPLISCNIFGSISC